MTDDLAGAFAGALYRVFTERDLMHGFRDAFIAEAALNDAADFAEIVRDLRVHRPVANPLTNDGDICAACSTEDGVTALWPCVPASAVPEPTDLRALVGHWDTEHAAFVSKVRPGRTRTFCDHCDCRSWMTPEDERAMDAARSRATDLLEATK